MRRVFRRRSLLVDESLLPAELLFSNAAATLNSAQERSVEVAPCVADRAVRPVALSLAELQLLTLEVLIRCRRRRAVRCSTGRSGGYSRLRRRAG